MRKNEPGEKTDSENGETEYEKKPVFALQIQETRGGSIRRKCVKQARWRKQKIVSCAP